jgi:co-chaperonin GroES (HSP10)
VKFRPLHDRVVVRRIEEDTKAAASSFPTLRKRSRYKAMWSPRDLVAMMRAV